MSMEEPENFVDHVHLIDCQPRQVGRTNAVREWIAALEAQGKRVVVIGMDSPRLPLLGAANALMEYRTDFHPPVTPFLDRIFPPEEYKEMVFDRFLKSMMTPSSEWLDPIPTQVKKPDWREDRMAFLNGIAGKKKHQK